MIKPKVNIEGKIQNRFRRGDNSLSISATLTERLRSKYANYDIRYTDGSSSVRGVGIGIASQNISICHSLPAESSVFSNEAAAIFEAISIPSASPILVLTDSASVISALQAEEPSHPWIQGIITGRPQNCTFAWIPGHCGISGNDTADLLAGTGYQSPRYTVTVPVNHKITDVSVIDDFLTVRHL